MIKDTFPMNIGEEKVRSERTLLAGVEDGKNMILAITFYSDNSY